MDHRAYAIASASILVVLNLNMSAEEIRLKINSIRFSKFLEEVSLALLFLYTKKNYMFHLHIAKTIRLDNKLHLLFQLRNEGSIFIHTLFNEYYCLIS